MQVIVGIDLGSTTTKAVLIDPDGRLVGRGITNSRSNYEVACAIARQEALTAVRFNMLERAIEELEGDASRTLLSLQTRLSEAFRLELYLTELVGLREEILGLLDQPHLLMHRAELEPAATEVLDRMAAAAPMLFLGGVERRSDFFRDLAGAAFMSESEALCKDGAVSFERLVGLYDRAILEVETRVVPHDFGALLGRAGKRVTSLKWTGAGDAPLSPQQSESALLDVVHRVAAMPLEELTFVGTGYGRQTLPFPKAAVRSEILCHGRGAHRLFPGTRTVLDIGGQDTKAIQVDEHGVVTSFQMNDRCAAGCGRYLGYIADELNLGLHELGPLALKAERQVRVNSTCTVFAGAELRERLSLGQRREDILAGLHRAIMLRAMSLLARSGVIRDEFTFTGGVCKNPMATQILRELVTENYSADITLNAHPDSIFMGALGAALFGLDDVRAGKPNMMPSFAL